MSTTLRTRGKALLLELGVVFLGVLIALAADSWWENLEEEKRELAYIRALVVDLTAARDTLDKTVRQAREGVQVMTDFLTLVNSAAPLPDRPANQQTTTLPQVFVPIGTLEALLTTGDVSIVRDEDLRAAIIREHASIQDAKRALDREQASLLALRKDFFALARASGGSSGIYPDAREVADLARLDPEFNALLSVQLSSFGTYVFIQETMRSSVDTLLATAQRVLRDR